MVIDNSWSAEYSPDNRLQTLRLLLRSTAISLGFTTSAYVTVFNPTIGVVTFRLRGWCMLGVFLLPAFTRLMSGSVESVRWNACAHRLELGLHSHPKEFFEGMDSETMLTPREKIPS